MSLTHRIVPGDPLDADEVEQNFADLDSLISPLTEARIERGAVATRHAESANWWKKPEMEVNASAVALSGTPAILTPAASSNYVTEANEAYLVLGNAYITSTGANPQAILRIKIGGSSVIQRRSDFPAGCHHSFPIAWLAVAAGASTQVELEGEGANCTVQHSQLFVLAIRR